MLVYCLDRYKIQRMCYKAIDDCLIALKCIYDWFVTSKILEKFGNILDANDDIIFYNENFNKSHIYCWSNIYYCCRSS